MAIRVEKNPDRNAFSIQFSSCIFFILVIHLRQKATETSH